MPDRIVISGYYGFGNTGDEAVLSGMLAAFEQTDVEARVVVLSADPDRTRLEHPGVESVHRYRPVPVLREISRADLLISGGGSLFQDVTSRRSVHYYLWILRLARLLRRPSMIYAQGVGPLTSEATRSAVADVFNRTRAVTVRDDESRALLEEIGVDRPPITVVADPAFLVRPDFEAADAVIRENGLEGREFIAVSLRPWPRPEGWLDAASTALASVKEHTGAALVAIPMQQDQDMAACEAIPGAVVLRDLPGPDVVKAVIGRSSLLVGMRLHSLIFAAAEGTPFVPVVYDPKVASFAAQMGVPRTVGVDSLTADSFAEAVIRAWDQRASLADDISAAAAETLPKALEAARIARQLLQEH